MVINYRYIYFLFFRLDDFHIKFDDFESKFDDFQIGFDDFEGRFDDFQKVLFQLIKLINKSK